MRLIDFDNLRRSTRSVFEAEYPTGLIDWGKDTWAIHAPSDKFGSFGLSRKDLSRTEGSFKFVVPRVFTGIDVYNWGQQAGNDPPSFAPDSRAVVHRAIGAVDADPDALARHRHSNRMEIRKRRGADFG